MDFNVADSVRRDIKVLVTKTHYTVVYVWPSLKPGPGEFFFGTTFNLEFFFSKPFLLDN